MVKSTQVQRDKVSAVLQNIIDTQDQWSEHLYTNVRAATRFWNSFKHLDEDTLLNDTSESTDSETSYNQHGMVRAVKYTDAVTLTRSLRNISWFPKAQFTTWPLDDPADSSLLSMIQYAHTTLYGSPVFMTATTAALIKPSEVLAWASTINIGWTPCRDTINDVIGGTHAAGDPLPSNRTRVTALKLLCFRFTIGESDMLPGRYSDRWFILASQQPDEWGGGLLYPTVDGQAYRIGDYLTRDAYSKSSKPLHNKLTSYCFPNKDNNYSRIVELHKAYFLYEPITPPPSTPVKAKSPPSAKRSSAKKQRGHSNKSRKYFA